MLEASDAPLEAIANEVGYEDAPRGFTSRLRTFRDFDAYRAYRRAKTERSAEYLEFREWLEWKVYRRRAEDREGSTR